MHEKNIIILKMYEKSTKNNFKNYIAYQISA